MDNHTAQIDKPTQAAGAQSDSNPRQESQDSMRSMLERMRKRKLFLAILLASSSLTLFAQSSQPDNSKANQGDQKAGAITADQQKMNAADRDLTQKIRKAVMADKSLSTNAHNIKIISRDGMVTLKGPVKSDDERKSIVAKAAGVTGDANKVSDQITVTN